MRSLHVMWRWVLLGLLHVVAGRATDSVSAFMRACIQGNARVVHAELVEGADIFEVDETGFTCTEIAERLRYRAVLDVLKRWRAP